MATNNIVITDEGQTIALILDDNDDEFIYIFFFNERIFNSIYQCTKSIIMMMTSGSKCVMSTQNKREMQKDNSGIKYAN